MLKKTPLLKLKKNYNKFLSDSIIYRSLTNNLKLYYSHNRSCNFLYGERDGTFENDNLIIYSAGPMDISISGWSGLITIKTIQQWAYLMPEIIDIIKVAWGVDDTKITKISDTEIAITYDFEILKKYIEHVITFI